MNEISSRSLTIAYTLALAIVAALSFFSHVTISGIMHEQEGSAAIINISGRQRMLAQRIASTAAQYALGDDNARRELIAATNEFEAFHGALAHGDAERHIPAPATPELVAIYERENGGLDAAARLLITHARAIANVLPGDPDMREELKPLLALADAPLLRPLDDVVRFHQNAGERQLDKLEFLQNLSLIIVFMTLIAEAMGIFRPMVAKIQRYTSELLRIAIRDPLTGAFNRKGFTENALKELARARRYGRPTSFLMFDADNFKAINDRFGHGGGDSVLQAMAVAVDSCLRPADIFCRLGGEEFGVMLAETDIDGALAAAERIRRRVEDLRVKTPAGVVNVTVSIGASQFKLGALSLKTTMERADAALYKAKTDGRNRVVAATIEPSATAEPQAQPV